MSDADEEFIASDASDDDKDCTSHPVVDCLVGDDEGCVRQVCVGKDQKVLVRPYPLSRKLRVTSMTVSVGKNGHPSIILGRKNGLVEVVGEGRRAFKLPGAVLLVYSYKDQIVAVDTFGNIVVLKDLEDLKDLQTDNDSDWRLSESLPMFDLSKSKEEEQPLVFCEEPIYGATGAVCWSTGGSVLCIGVCYQSGDVVVYKLKSNKLSTMWSCVSNPDSCVGSPDRFRAKSIVYFSGFDMIAVGDTLGRIRLFNYRQDQQSCLCEFQGTNDRLSVYGLFGWGKISRAANDKVLAEKDKVEVIQNERLGVCDVKGHLLAFDIYMTKRSSTSSDVCDNGGSDTDTDSYLKDPIMLRPKVRRVYSKTGYNDRGKHGAKIHEVHNNGRVLLDNLSSSSCTYDICILPVGKIGDSITGAITCACTDESKRYLVIGGLHRHVYLFDMKENVLNKRSKMPVSQSFVISKIRCMYLLDPSIHGVLCSGEERSSTHISKKRKIENDTQQ